MSRGYRHILVAFAGLAALFTALGLGTYVGSLYAPDHKNYAGKPNNGRPGNDYQGPSQSLPDIAGVPRVVERGIANPRPDTGQDHEKRDLAAQEASALWAFWMVTISACSTVVTIIGTIMLYQQIVLTRKAVKDTGNATEAMLEANAIAMNAQRPWLKVTATATGNVWTDRPSDNPLEHQDSAFEIIVLLKIENLGLLPCNFQAHLALHEHFGSKRPESGESAASFASNILPSDELSINPLYISAKSKQLTVVHQQGVNTVIPVIWITCTYQWAGGKGLTRRKIIISESESPIYLSLETQRQNIPLYCIETADIRVE